MQNKGFVKVFAVLLTLVCVYYLSFSFVTRYYESKAIEFSNGDLNAESHYLDSLSTQKVWLGYYTLKQCREKEIGLGLDLKGGMNVILEIDAAAVLNSLANTDNAHFNQALREAVAENRSGSNLDFITLFKNKFEAIDKNAKLADIFSNTLRGQVNPTDNNDKVIAVLRGELKSVADNSFNVLRTRIDRFGVVAPNIQKLDRAERILIELPGVKEPERVKKLLQGSANLEFWKAYNISTITNYLSEINARSTQALASKGKATTASLKDSTASDSLATAATETSASKLAFNKSFFQYFAQAYFAQGNVGGPILGTVNKNDTAAVGAILDKYKDLYPTDMKFKWGFKAVDDKESLYQLYVLRGDGIKRGPALDGDVVVQAKADQGQKGTGWEVSMEMNASGTKRWANITGAEKGNSIAIVLDGHVYSAPNVNDKIEGGRSQITGNFTPEEAKDLENVLKSGKMKAGVRIVQEDIVGPSLGEEAIQAGLISLVVALFILMAYMCLVYGLIPGLIANGALLLNLFFTLGILASFHAVMTLPGICGLVLAMAMAVDANVLIYERTKEELRAGKNTKKALEDGYKHAFTAIFDSNLTSIITGLILYNFGTGPIRGFAITEIIGISASFFTAIFMTRLVYDYAFSKGKFQNLKFSSEPLRNFLMDTKINFLNLHRKAYAFSAVLVLIGVISIFTLGLNRGIDFTGGRNYIVRFDKPVNTQDLADALRPQLELDGSTVSVITIGTSNQVRISTNYKIQDSSDGVETEIRNKMTEALKSHLKAGTTINDNIQSSQKVGPSVADDMKTAAVLAVSFAILCMGLYILFRFRDVAFSVGTIIAVAHDAAIVIFAYSLCHRFLPFSLEINQEFIAAILTVVGFSIHDKVVIFDRVRERRHEFPLRPISANINDSLNTTLTRTISVSLSTILVLLCIFVLGGDSLRSFSFAMILGILFGTYSSVFIATPIAFEIMHKKDEKRQKELSGK
jgi:SecD/SecF fusion protein